MTATNHAVTGALIATIVPSPFIAIPLAFAAHFVMDAIPHFGLNEKDVFRRNNNQAFFLVLAIDVIIAGLLLLALPGLLSSFVNPWVTFFSMFACMSPDLVWGWHYYFAVKHNTRRKLKMFSQFHKKIQWSETPKGLIVEILWFVAILNLVFLPL